MNADEAFSFDHVPLMSDMSERPPWSITTDEIEAEVDELLAWRRAIYPRAVERGEMIEGKAEHHIDIIDAIRDDLMIRYDPATECWFGRRWPWQVKVAEIRRELEQRRTSWPKRIADPADPFTAATAQQRMEAWEGLHFRYWMELHGADREFTGTSDVRSRLIKAAHRRRIAWYRGALARGGRDARCVPPNLAELITDAAAGDATAIHTLVLFTGNAEEPA
jgi:hypothetical protein